MSDVSCDTHNTRVFCTTSTYTTPTPTLELPGSCVQKAAAAAAAAAAGAAVAAGLEPLYPWGTTITSRCS